MTVNTHRGLYQYLRLPFEVASAPTLFQKNHGHRATGDSERHMIHPLNGLLQKSRCWEWNDDCKRAFKMVKVSLTPSRVLVHYDSTLPLCLAADS